MSYRPYQEIIRRKSRRVHVGRVPVGDGAPITVQTMTNTLTTDVAGTVAQIRRAELAGVDIVRVSCPDQESALALKDIVPEVNVPIVADIHFHYRRAIEAADSGAACLRINPGNIGSAGAGEGGHQGGARPRLLDADRGERGLAGEAPAGEIRRAEPRGAGGERAVPRRHPAAARLPRLQDQREGVGRVPGGGGVSAAGRGLRPPAAYRHHRGGRAAHGHGEVGGRAGLAALGRDRRHAAGVAVGRAGGGGAGRLGPAEDARASAIAA